MTDKNIQTQQSVTVIVSDNIYSKEENNKFFDSLFACQLPLKIIVQRSMLENGNFPLEYLERENLLPLHGDDFIKEARKKNQRRKSYCFKKTLYYLRKSF